MGPTRRPTPRRSPRPPTWSGRRAGPDPRPPPDKTKAAERSAAFSFSGLSAWGSAERLADAQERAAGGLVGALVVHGGRLGAGHAQAVVEVVGVVQVAPGHVRQLETDVEVRLRLVLDER